MDYRSDLIIGVEMAMVAVLPGPGHHVIPVEVELSRAILVREDPELVHERAAAYVVPIGINVDLS